MKFPDSATHAVDFRSDGLSSISPLTAKNLESRGIRVIVVGNRAKSDAELYSSEKVIYEDWWGKKYSPGLIRTRYIDLLGFDAFFSQKIPL